MGQRTTMLYLTPLFEYYLYAFVHTKSCDDIKFIIWTIIKCCLCAATTFFLKRTATPNEYNLKDTQCN